MLLAGLVSGAAAAPALASAGSHHRSASAAAIAEWRSSVRLPSGRVEVTTWFVGLFPSTSRTRGDVFKDVASCKRVNGHLRCRAISFSSGFRSLTAAEFSFDRKRLQAAHLDATFTLHTFTPGKPSKTSRVRVVADWTGTGKIVRSSGNNTFHSGCVHFHSTFKDRHRAATATGTFGGTALGNARNAFLDTSTDVTVVHRC
jgi:hypothetical protein